jgi:hypothetical protein
MGHCLWDAHKRLAVGAFALAVFALAVSLPHLAEGYHRLALEWWECWCLASVTDLTQVVAKLLVLAFAARTTVAVAVRRRRRIKAPLRQAA